MSIRLFLSTLLVLVLCLLPVNGWATIRIVDEDSDLPINNVTTFDTITITATVHTPDRMFTILSGAHDLRIYQTDPVNDTVYWGENGYHYNGTPDYYARGFWIVGNNYNMMFEDLNLVYNPPLDSLVDTVLLGPHLTRMGGSTHDITFQNSYVRMAGRNSQMWVDQAGAINATLRNIKWDNRSEAFTARDQMEAYSMVSIFGMNTRASSYAGFEYHYRIVKCSTLAADWVNYSFTGDSMKVWVDSCYLYADAVNTLPNLNDIYGVAEQTYLITADDNNNSAVNPYGGVNLKITNNQFRSGTQHAGSAAIGISTAGADTTEEGGNWIYNNDIQVHKGWAGYYNNSYGMQFRQNTANVVFRKNYVHMSGGTDNSDSSYSDWVVAMHIYALYGDPANIIVDSNVIEVPFRDMTATANPLANTRGAYGIMFGAGTAGTSGLWSRYNRISAGSAPFMWGEPGNPNPNLDGISIGDTLILLDSGTVNQWPVISCVTGNARNKMIDVYYDSTSESPVNLVGFAGSDVGDVTIQKTLNITVLGTNGVPVQGARVRVRNNPATYNQNVMLDNATDVLGLAEPTVVSIRYYEDGTSDSGSYNPFIMSAIVGTDSVAEVKNFNWATSGTDTLVMAHTLGGISVSTPVTIGSEGVYNGTYSDGSLLSLPRRNFMIAGDTLGLHIKAGDNPLNPAWSYSVNQGETWTAVMGNIDGGNDPGIDYHASDWAHSNGGFVCTFPSSSAPPIGFRRFNSFSEFGTNPVRDPISLGGSWRSAGYSNGDTSWVVARLSSTYTSLWFGWSTDDFVTVHEGTISLPAGASNLRIGLFPDGNGNPNIWAFLVGVGVRKYPWNGTTFVSDAYTNVTTLSGDEWDRAFSILCDKSGYWHYVMSTGPYGTTVDTVVHVDNTTGTWVRTKVSNVGYFDNGNQANVSPILTTRNDSVFVFYACNNLFGVAMKIRDPITGWDKDSALITPAGEVIGANGFQVPYNLPDTLAYIPIAWLNNNYSGRFSQVLISSAPAGGEIEITSLPYTVSTSNSTYFISQDLHADGNAITFANGVHDVVLYQDAPETDTIYWGELGEVSVIGIDFEGNNYNIDIHNINLVQNCLVPASLVDGFNLNTDAFNLTPTVHDVTFSDSYVYIHGQSAQAWYSTENYNIDLRNITWDNDSHAFVDRTGYANYSMISLNGLNDNTQSDFLYHYRIDKCATTNANWINYYVHGTVADVIIDTCDIYMDAINSLSNSGTAGSAEQCYGVVIYGGTAQNVQVTYCTFTSGTQHAGSDGIYVNSAGVDTTQTDAIWIYGNLFTTTKGYADELNKSSVIKLHQNTKNVVIRKNDIRSTGDTNDLDSAYTDLVEGIRIEEIYNDPANIIIDSNTVNITYRDLTAALNFTTGSEQGAVGIRFALTSDIGGSVLPDSIDNIYCRYNKITAGSVPYMFGSDVYNLEGVGIEIFHDTIAISDSSTTNYYTFYLIGNHPGVDSSCINRAVDCYYDVASGADPGNMGFINQGDLAVKSTLHVNVVGSNSRPISGATIRVVNSYGQVIIDDVSSDTLGNVIPVLTEWRRRFSSYDSSGYNPLTVTATYGTDVNSHSFSLGYTTAAKNDTIMLNGTLGGITISDPITITTGLTNAKPLFGTPYRKGGILNDLLWLAPAQGLGNPAWVHSADDGDNWTSIFGGYFGRDYTQSAWVTLDDHGAHLAYPKYTLPGAVYSYVASPSTSWGDVSAEIELTSDAVLTAVYSYGDTTWVATCSSDNSTDDIFIYWSTNHFLPGSINYDTISMPGDVVTSDNPRIVIQTDATGVPILWTLNPGDGWQYYEWLGTELGFVASSDFLVTGTEPYANDLNNTFQVTYSGGMWHLFVGVGTAGTADLHHYSNPNHGTSDTWELEYVSLNSSHSGIEFYVAASAYHEDTVAVFYTNPSNTVVMKLWTLVGGMDADSVIIATGIGWDVQVPFLTTTKDYLPIWYTSLNSPFTLYFKKITFATSEAPPAAVTNLFFRRLRGIGVDN